MWRNIIKTRLGDKVSVSFTRYNRPFSYSQFWTGTSLQWRLVGPNISKETLRISLDCKLVPVQTRGYKYGLLYA